MGLQEYLERDLELMNDPDLLDDDDDDGAEGDYKRMRAARQRAEQLRRRTYRAQMQATANMVSADAAALAQSGSSSRQGSGGSTRTEQPQATAEPHDETMLVGETRLTDEPANLTPPLVAAAAVHPSAAAAAASALSPLHACTSSSARAWTTSVIPTTASITLTSDAVPTMPAAPTRPRHPLAETMIASSPVSEAPTSATVVDAPSPVAVDPPATQEPVWAPKHLHHYGGHAAGLMPRNIGERVLSTAIDMRDPWTRTRVTPFPLSAPSSRPPSPPYRTPIGISPPITPAQAGPSTLAQFENLTNVTSPTDSILEFSPAPAPPPPSRVARPPTVKSKTYPTAAVPKQKNGVEAVRPKQPVVLAKSTVPAKRASTSSASVAAKGKKAKMIVKPKQIALVQYAQIVNDALRADLEKSRVLFDGPVVLDGSQETPEPLTADELARIKRRKILKGVGVFLLWEGMTLCNEPNQQLLDKISALGAEVHADYTLDNMQKVTHILSDFPKPEHVLQSLKFKSVYDLDAERPGVVYLKTQWVRECFERNKKVDYEPYYFFPQHRAAEAAHTKVMVEERRAAATRASTYGTSIPTSIAEVATSIPTADKSNVKARLPPSFGDEFEAFLKGKHPSSAAAEDDDEDFSSDDDTSDKVPVQDAVAERVALRKARQERRIMLQEQGGVWACMRSSLNGPPAAVGNNALIIAEFEKLARIYEGRPDDNEFHARSYSRVINLIRSYPMEIMSKQQAMRIKGIGEKHGAKIEEILKNGRTQRLAYEEQDPKNKVLYDFTRIYGIGLKSADELWSMGARCVADLRGPDAAVQYKLSTAAQIGVKLYDDLLERIPRAECTEIHAVIAAAVKELDPVASVELVGSYLRGSKDCGDVDVLMSRNTADGQTHAGLFEAVVKSLHASGFLTHDLSVTIEPGALECTYHGVCRLSPEHKYRRLDILTVPFHQLGGALIFTGDDHFNRSLRKYAGTKSLRLNQRGLFQRATKGLQDHTSGEIEAVASRTEQEIFDYLGVRWRPPTERNC